MRIIADIFEFTTSEDAAIQQHQHLRLPHAGGRRDGRYRAGLHLADGVEYVRTRLEAGLASTPSRRGISFFWASA
jgi:methylmalonyl-CoA mutase N-terminal domain/subunit